MKRLRNFFDGGFFLALFVLAYPVVFLYSHNARFLLLSHLAAPLGLAAGLGVVVYGVYRLVEKKAVYAGLSTLVFFLFFFNYGPVFDWLWEMNILPIEHYTLLPFMVIAGFYAGCCLVLIKEKVVVVLQKILLPVTAALLLLNIVLLAPVEAAKAQQANTTAAPAGASKPNGRTSPAASSYPDIYYIILDEYAGFDAIREYWHDDYVNQFENFLKSRGFFIAGKSRSRTTSTLREMADRLNLRIHPFREGTMYFLYLQKEVTDNKVFRVVKSYGYSTVVLNSLFPPFAADDNISIGQDEASQASENAKEFYQMLTNNTMFMAFPDLLLKKVDEEVLLNQVKDSMDRTASLDEVPSPKFVYAHFRFPHMPFIVDEAGNLIDPQRQFNWHAYLGQHKYTTQLIEELIPKILANYPPENPPVIILQSDHGARNTKVPSLSNVVFDDYPVKYKADILNALYLPGYDTSQLPDDMEPIRALEVVLNHYLHAGVEVEMR